LLVTKKSTFLGFEKNEKTKNEKCGFLGGKKKKKKPPPPPPPPPPPLDPHNPTHPHLHGGGPHKNPPLPHLVVVGEKFYHFLFKWVGSFQKLTFFFY